MWLRSNLDRLLSEPSVAKLTKERLLEVIVNKPALFDLEERDLTYERLLERGRMEGRVEALLRMLQRRFGPLSAKLEARVRAAGDATLDRFFDRILDARTTEEVIGPEGPS